MPKRNFHRLPKRSEVGFANAGISSEALPPITNRLLRETSQRTSSPFRPRAGKAEWAKAEYDRKSSPRKIAFFVSQYAHILFCRNVAFACKSLVPQRIEQVPQICIEKLHLRENVALRRIILDLTTFVFQMLHQHEKVVIKDSSRRIVFFSSIGVFPIYIYSIFLYFLFRRTKIAQRCGIQ